MNPKRWVFRVLSVAAVGAGALFSGSSTWAANIELKDNNGVSAGWTISVPDADASRVQLRFSSSSGNRFFFIKDASFTNNSDPLVLSFDKTGPNAKDLVIQNENITNNSGSDWVGFRTLLSSGSVAGTPNFSFVTSDNSPGLGDFSIDPFTTFQFLNSNTELFVNGGTVAKGGVWRPGSQSGTGLAIVTSAGTATHFELKEIPIAGSGGGTVIPLPAAAWTGLSTLLGLGLLSGTRKLYRRIA